MLHHVLNRSTAGSIVPLIVMPESTGDPQVLFDRVVAAAEAVLPYPVLVVAPDVSAPNAVESWPAVLGELRAEYDLTERGLVLGGGTGARLAQYFALENPEAVRACAALSADAWASLSDVEPSEATAAVQWLIGCGTKASVGGLKRAELFQIELAEAGCAVDFLDWDGDETALPDHALSNAMYFFADLTTDARQAA